MQSAAHPYYFDASPTLLAIQPAITDRMAPAKPPIGWNPLYVHLEGRLVGMRQWRLSWWQSRADIARYELPRRYQAFITANTYDKGLRRDWNIVDSTATLDGETCAGGMMTVICPPDRPWLQLGPGIPGLELDRAGQMWFEEVTERLRYVQAETNFYDSMAQYFEDMVFFGTGVVIDYEDSEDIFTCVNPCAGEYYLAAGQDLANQSLYTEERRTVAQIVEQFGIEHCPEDIRRQWQAKGGALEQEHIVGHAIEPNFQLYGDQGPNGAIAEGFPWREVYWLVGKSSEAGPLSIAGFHEKPHAVSGWHKVSNDPYYRGPGDTALGDVIQLQLETRQKAEALEKVVKPPMGADPVLKNDPSAGTRPGQITYYDTTNGKKGFHPLYEVRPDIAAITADITSVQERIGRTFHAKLFRMIEELSNTKRDVSATEIDALKEERLMQLGPVIGRVYKDGVRPRIRRQLSIMARRGLLPPKPRSLQNVPVQIEFISMLTMAQRASATASIERTFGFAGNIAAAWPDAKDVLDPEEGIRVYGDLKGVPARIVRAPQDLRRLRAQQNQQKQAQEMAQAGMAGVQGAQVLSKTDLGGPNALTALTGGPVLRA